MGHGWAVVVGGVHSDTFSTCAADALACVLISQKDARGADDNVDDADDLEESGEDGDGARDDGVLGGCGLPSVLQLWAICDFRSQKG